MTGVNAKPIAVRPRCDGRRLLFEMVEEGRSVACAISLMALEDVSGGRCSRPADQLRSFTVARERIEAIALGKIRARAQDASGLLNIWSNDVESDDVYDPPPASEPAAAGRRRRGA